MRSPAGAIGRRFAKFVGTIFDGGKEAEGKGPMYERLAQEPLNGVGHFHHMQHKVVLRNRETMF